MSDWKCCGCGKPSPDQRRNCNCPTGVLYRESTRDHVCKIEPDTEPQARATADAERLAEAVRLLRKIAGTGQSIEPDHWKFRCMARDQAAAFLLTLTQDDGNEP